MPNVFKSPFVLKKRNNTKKNKKKHKKSTRYGNNETTQIHTNMQTDDNDDEDDGIKLKKKKNSRFIHGFVCGIPNNNKKSLCENHNKSNTHTCTHNSKAEQQKQQRKNRAD